ncbi:MAG: hypothetical protein H7Z37_03805, partial [Pyrinomonadaceae bacterium]|nr:hypothetical protein [Pyrinomonadaceae bacterium]
MRNLFVGKNLVTGFLRVTRKTSIAATLLGCLLYGSQNVNAANFTVNTISDDGQGAACLASSCSLRQAIGAANATPGADTIVFTTAGNSTFSPKSPLPTITETVNITAPFTGHTTLSGLMAGDSYGLRFASTATGSVVQNMVVNSFQKGGIRVDANGTSLLGNYVGTDRAGQVAAPNFNSGVFIVGATGVLIGDGSTTGRNVISGNLGTGISVARGGSAVVRGNYIGVSFNGIELGNSLDGVLIADSPNSVIGGTNPADRNIISGNDANGVFIGQGPNATGNKVSANYIGLNVAGTGAIKNDGSGVVVNAPNNTIGGTTPGERNVISGNRVNGVSIGTMDATGNNVKGNYIGVAANGTTGLQNRINGVEISDNARNNLVGGTDVTRDRCDGSCNVIATNGDDGVVNITETTRTVGGTPLTVGGAPQPPVLITVPAQAIQTVASARSAVYVTNSAGRGNSIRRNSIFGSFGIGIDLARIGVNQGAANANCSVMTAGIGVNLIDAPNDLQNCPSLATVSTAGFITGTLTAQTPGVYVIDFYTNPAADGTATEARTYLSSFTTPALTAGQVYAIRVGGTGAVTAGELVSATATSPNGSTSEISSPAQVQTATAAGVSVGGKVSTGNGKGLFNAVVTLTDSNGAVRRTQTKFGGRYSFTDVPTGATYVINVQSKRYSFESQVQSITG